MQNLENFIPNFILPMMLGSHAADIWQGGAYCLIDSENSKIKQHVALLCTEDRMERQTSKFCYRVVNVVMPRTLWKQEGRPALPGMRWSGKAYL